MDKEYYRKYYKEHKDIILSGQLSKWKRAQKFVSEQKIKPCVDCKFVPLVPDQMDFDHVRGTKITDIARLVARGVSIKKIQEEIDKCDLVCANCHRLRTAIRRNLEALPSGNGNSLLS